MTSRVLSIEIGIQFTRVVEIDYKTKQPKIYQAFSFETPPDMIEDGVVKSDARFLAQFKQELLKNRIRTRRAVFNIRSGRIAQREIEIPFVKEKRIHSLLITNIADYFPVDLTKYQLIHQVLEKRVEDKKIKIAAIAVPNDLLLSYQELAEYCGLTIVAVDYTAHSIFNSMALAKTQGVYATLQMDERESVITVLENGAIALQRTIGYGLDEALETVRENWGTEKLSHREALEVLKTETCMYQTLDSHQNTKVYLEKGEVLGEREEETEDEITREKRRRQEQVTDALRMLLGNIERVISYYNSNHPNAVIEKITFMGLGAECMGMRELLEGHLNIPVQKLNAIGSIRIPKELEDKGFSICVSTIVIGAAMNPMNLQIRKLKFTEEQEKKNEAGVTTATVICGICLVVSAGLALIPFIENRSLTYQKTNLETQINSMQEAKDIYDEYVWVEGIYNDYSSLETITATPLDQLLAFIENLENKMPSDIQVSVMSATESDITLDVTTTSKYSALDVMVKLRECDPLTDFTIGSVTESTGDNQQKTEQFTVICTLQGMEQQEEEQTAQSDEVLEETMQEDDTLNEDMNSLTGSGE